MHIDRLIERFLRETDMPATKFGRLAAHDPRLVLDMRMGREVRPATEAKLRQFIAHYSKQDATPNAAV